MKRVAIVISMIDESCQSQIWDGISLAARQLGIDLVSFPAASEENVTDKNSHYDLISNYISPDIFDGLILFSGAMAEYTDWSAIKQYANSFKVPVISISGDVGSDLIKLLSKKNYIANFYPYQ